MWPNWSKLFYELRNRQNFFEMVDGGRDDRRGIRLCPRLARPRVVQTANLSRVKPLKRNGKSSVSCGARTRARVTLIDRLR
jgi:hypothetical protein